ATPSATPSVAPSAGAEPRPMSAVVRREVDVVQPLPAWALAIGALLLAVAALTVVLAARRRRGTPRRGPGGRPVPPVPNAEGRSGVDGPGSVGGGS
ncbi:hypothetical protein, partial [Actinotalea sp. JY-7885]